MGRISLNAVVPRREAAVVIATSDSPYLGLRFRVAG
jgi:hypothetical protein